MALSGLKQWHLRGLASNACVLFIRCPFWKPSVREMRTLGRTVCVTVTENRLTTSHRSVCGSLSLPVFMNSFPNVPLCTLSGMRSHCSSASLLCSPFSRRQSVFPFISNTNNDCNIMDKKNTNTTKSPHKTVTYDNRLQHDRIWAPIIQEDLTTEQSCANVNVTQAPRNLVPVELTSSVFRSKVFGKTPIEPWHQGMFSGRGRFSPVTVLGRRNYTVQAHKPVSVLAVKRPIRKKTVKTEQEELEQRDTVVAYALAEELNLGHLKEALVTQGLYLICPLPIDAQDALHVQAKYMVDGKKREIFFFRDGSAVFWSMTEVERKEALRFIRKHDIGGYAPNLILREREEMDVKYVSGPTGVSGDMLQLSENQEEGQSTLEKYAFSNALAQSVKLSIWESSLETFVDSIEHVTEDLRDGKKISMSRREVLRKTGELFALRHLINLSSDLLDTPDFYWDRAVLEPLYMGVCNHLSISRRTKVMNEKLSHCCELTELLSSHLNDAHHTRLEVMIIVLIMVEVVFEIVHYIERYISNVNERYINNVHLPSDPVAEPSVAPSSGSL